MIPFILQVIRRAISQNESVIVMDPKEEFYEMLSKELE